MYSVYAYAIPRLTTQISEQKIEELYIKKRNIKFNGIKNSNKYFISSCYK